MGLSTVLWCMPRTDHDIKCSKARCGGSSPRGCGGVRWCMHRIKGGTARCGDAAPTTHRFLQPLKKRGCPWKLVKKPAVEKPAMPT